MLIDCCAMEKMFNRPCSFDGGAFDNFTDSCRWFQIDPLITTLFISIRFLADLLHSLSPHCYAQVLRTAGMDGKAIEIGEIAKQLSSFSSSHLFRLGASELMVTCPFQCLHYQAERLCRLNPVYQESSQVSTFNSCLVLCNFHRIKLSAPRAGERTTSPRVSEFNSTLCTGGGRIYLMVSVGTQVEVLWNAYLSCYVIVHGLFANHTARAYYKMIHGNPHAMWTFARTEKVSFWVNCSRMHSLATHIWNTCLMPKVAPLQSRHLNVPLVFADVQLTRCRLETNKLRNIGKFFAHLLYTDWRYWSCWVKHKTTLSPDKDLFLKWVSCCWICWTFWALSITPAIPHQTAPRHECFISRANMQWKHVKTCPHVIAGCHPMEHLGAGHIQKFQSHREWLTLPHQGQTVIVPTGSHWFPLVPTGSHCQVKITEETTTSSSRIFIKAWRVDRRLQTVPWWRDTWPRWSFRSSQNSPQPSRTFSDRGSESFPTEKNVGHRWTSLALK